MGRDHTAHGRARHPWLTGSAGWAYFAATRYLIGLRFTFDGMQIDPCIPAEWDGFSAQRRWRGALYRIQVENPSHVEKGVVSVTLNGKPVKGAIPPMPEGSENEVVIRMGR